MSLSVEASIGILVSLLFVILGLVLVSTILAQYDPYFYIATRNTEKLRDTMEFACANNVGLESNEIKKISFSLPQNVPSLATVFASASGWLIHKGGDPHYTLYYEMFPAGDAIGWEAFYRFNSRALASIPEEKVAGRTYSIKDVDDYLKKVKEKLDQKRDSNGNKIVVDMIILRNIILNSEIRPYNDYKFGTVPQDYYIVTGTKWPEKVSALETIKSGFFGYGEWKQIDPQDPKKKRPVSGDNYFEFHNYNAMPETEKTALKYIPCGDHALCLKTRNGVYRYDMPQCRNEDIKYVAFGYEERRVKEAYVASIGGAAVGIGTIIYFGPVAVASATFSMAAPILSTPYIRTMAAIEGLYAADRVAHYFFTAFFAYKSSDFSLVSPCNINEMEISVKYCSAISDEYSCKRMEKIPLMEYSTEGGVTLMKYSQSGTEMTRYHYTCIEKSNDKIDKPTENKDENEVFSLDSIEGGAKCLFVKVTKLPKGYCWTPDPYKEVGLTNIISQPSTNFFGRKLGVMPVKDYMSYAYEFNEPISPVTLLMPYNEFGGFISRSARKLSWGWPADKSDKDAITDALGVLSTSLFPPS